MADEFSKLTNEVAALCSLVEAVDRLECSALVASVRFPNSAVIDQLQKGLGPIRFRLMRAIRAQPQCEEAKRFVKERKGGGGRPNAMGLLKALRDEASAGGDRDG